MYFYLDARSVFQLFQPIQMCSHIASNLSQEEGGCPASPPASLSQTGLSLPHLPSHTLSLSLSLSLFFQHVPVVMLMAVTGSASLSGCPSCPFPSRWWCVITEQRQAEWSDWWGDCDLLTEVFVWLKDVLPLAFWDRRLASLGTDSCGADLSAQDAALTFHKLPSLLSGFLLIVFSRRFHHERPITISHTVAWSGLPGIPARHL